MRRKSTIERPRSRAPAARSTEARATNGLNLPAAIEIPVGKLRPYAGNPRTHSKKQVRQIADSIRQFGFTNPVLIGEDGEIIAGHGRVEAAKLLGMATVPILRLAHLDAVQRRAYVLADNKLALNAGWDPGTAHCCGGERSAAACWPGAVIAVASPPPIIAC
jgi:hypothetical protein